MIDGKDRKIIEELKQNARMPIRNIAKKTALRPSTVHQRLEKLKKSVIERFTVKLRNKEVDESFIVFMLIKTAPNLDIEDRVFSNPHIREVFGVTGEYDLLLKLKFRDVIEFNEFLLKFRKEQKIQTTHTLVATAEIKEEI